MTWAYIQSTSQGTSASSLPVAVTYTQQVTAGHLLLVFVDFLGGAAQTVSVSDSQGNSYSPALSGTYQNGPSGDTGQRVSLWYAIAKSTDPSGGPFNQVTVTPSASLAMCITIHEYSGNAASGVLDQAVSANGTGLAPSCGSVGVSGSNELVFAAFGQLAHETSITSSSLTVRATVETGGSEGSAGSGDALAVSSAVTGAFTTNVSAAWTALGASFNGAAATLSAGPLPNIIVSCADPYPEDLE